MDLVGNENKARGAASTTRKQQQELEQEQELELEAEAATRRLTSPEQRHLTQPEETRTGKELVVGDGDKAGPGPLPGTGDGLEKRRQPSAKFRQFYGNGAAF